MGDNTTLQGPGSAEESPYHSHPLLGGPLARRALVTNRVRRAVDQGLRRWPGHGAVRPPGERSPDSDTQRPVPTLPRPQRLRVDWRKYAGPAQREKEVFKAGLIKVVLRLLVWLWAGVRFVAGTFWDWLRFRNSVENRAQRLRRIFESAGATFVKIGQQMSMRIDFLPYAYAHELEKLLDDVPRFPSEYAVKAIEKAAGKPLSETFQLFDPEPIASASIACVYQGILKNGDKVAIKVRRPNIGDTFAADIRGLSWLLRLLEAFLVPPGFSSHFTHELRTMLMEELDFAREARYTDLFRRGARKSKLRFVTSPRVYFDISNRQVLVTEFVTGVFLTELLAAVENNDERALAALKERNIDPSVVAKRLIWTNRFGGFEAILFHADLHPGNVLVLPNNKLVLLDFGSCGSFTEQERVVWRRVLYAQNNGDVGAMVQASLALLEPLPPIAIDEFAKRMEAVFWQDLYAARSKHSEWWEKTTANLWIGFFKLSREYNVPMNLNTLRLIRGTLLTDTVALRLDNSLDNYREYQKYLKTAGKRAKRRLWKRMRDSFGNAEFTQWEQVFQAGSSLIYRTQRVLDSSFVHYSKLQSNMAFLSAMTFRVSAALAGIAGAAVFSVWGYARLTLSADPLDPWQILTQVVLPNSWYQLFALLIVFVNVRRLMFYLERKEI